jgi:hypothetical protein
MAVMSVATVIRPKAPSPTSGQNGNGNLCIASLA